jgi:hypothetical protein
MDMFFIDQRTGYEKGELMRQGPAIMPVLTILLVKST